MDTSYDQKKVGINDSLIDHEDKENSDRKSIGDFDPDAELEFADN